MGHRHTAATSQHTAFLHTPGKPQVLHLTGAVIECLVLSVLQVWCVVLLCFILGLPMLHSYVAFAAITSIGVIGLYISYLGECCRSFSWD